jgi:hypothetical protein
MGVDATTKVYPETEAEWGAPLESDPEVARMVDRKWADYGLADINLNEVNPNMFGYDMQVFKLIFKLPIVSRFDIILRTTAFGEHHADRISTASRSFNGQDSWGC